MNAPLLVLRVYYGGYAAFWTQKFLTTFDVITNYLFIIMSYPLFNTDYERFCGWMDVKWRKCLTQKINGNECELKCRENQTTTMNKVEPDNDQIKGQISIEKMNIDDIETMKNCQDIFKQTRFKLCFFLFFCKMVIFVFILIEIVQSESEL